MRLKKVYIKGYLLVALCKADIKHKTRAGSLQLSLLCATCALKKILSYLQVSHDAKALGLIQSAGGGGGEFVRPADQQVTCGWVAAALGANIWELRNLLCPERSPQGCREERLVSVRCQHKALASFFFWF